MRTLALFVCILAVNACGPARSKQPARSAAETPLDGGTSPDSKEQGVLWDGICKENPLAKGCM